MDTLDRSDSVVDHEQVLQVAVVPEVPLRAALAAERTHGPLMDSVRHGSTVSVLSYDSLWMSIPGPCQSASLSLTSLFEQASSTDWSTPPRVVRVLLTSPST